MVKIKNKKNQELTALDLYELCEEFGMEATIELLKGKVMNGGLCTLLKDTKYEKQFENFATTQNQIDHGGAFWGLGVARFDFGHDYYSIPLNDKLYKFNGVRANLLLLLAAINDEL